MGHPDCVAALDDATRLCAGQVGHDMIEADLPGLDAKVGAAITTVFNAATVWIVAYWARRLGRDPQPGELEPLTHTYRAAGERISATQYLLAIEELQALLAGSPSF
jgi:amidase